MSWPIFGERNCRGRRRRRVGTVISDFIESSHRLFIMQSILNGILSFVQQLGTSSVCSLSLHCHYKFTSSRWCSRLCARMNYFPQLNPLLTVIVYASLVVSNLASFSDLRSVCCEEKTLPSLIPRLFLLTLLHHLRLLGFYFNPFPPSFPLRFQLVWKLLRLLFKTKTS